MCQPPAYLLLSTSPLEHKIRRHRFFFMFRLLLCPQHLEQCLVHSSCSINFWGVIE